MRTPFLGSPIPLEGRTMPCATGSSGGVCTGNHLGEFCEDSCGENGQVVNRFNGSACECSANYTGVFCNLRPGEIAEKEEEEEEEELVPRWLLLRPSSWSAEGTQSPVDASA
jgi:hypothetical protein